ncbi:MAG: ATP-binding protein [Bryobacteraceae bacterium]|nr:ATP-binding protein [Bryobacteraceae bacterium]
MILVGLPGCGKSTYVAKHRLPALSSDEMRRLLADDQTDQTIHGHVFAALRDLLRRRIAIGRPVTYIDATHLTPAERSGYVLFGRRYGCQVEALFFDAPLAVCKERNRGRARIVPEDALDAMAARLVPPSRSEGFDRVWVLRE